MSSTTRTTTLVFDALIDDFTFHCYRPISGRRTDQTARAAAVAGVSGVRLCRHVALGIDRRHQRSENSKVCDLGLCRLITRSSFVSPHSSWKPIFDEGDGTALLDLYWNLFNNRWWKMDFLLSKVCLNAYVIQHWSMSWSCNGNRCRVNDDCVFATRDTDLAL